MSDEEDIRKNDSKSRPWDRPSGLGVADVMGLAYLVLIAAVIVLVWVE